MRTVGSRLSLALIFAAGGLVVWAVMAAQVRPPDGPAFVAENIELGECPVGASSISVRVMNHSNEPALVIGTGESGRVEEWRGGVGWPCVLAGPFGCRRQSIQPGSVSTPRSANRTCGFAASGSRTRDSCRRTRTGRTRSPLEPQQPQLVVQAAVVVS
jgi:hypothetical protein